MKPGHVEYKDGLPYAFVLDTDTESDDIPTWCGIDLREFMVDKEGEYLYPELR